MKFLNNILSGGILTAACCLLLIGCSDSDKSSVNQTEMLELSFHTISSDQTKSIVNGISDVASEDKINLVGNYITNIKHEDYIGMTNRKSLWRYGSDGKWSTSPAILLTNEEGYLYSFYPSSLIVTADPNPVAGTPADNHTVPVTIPKNQLYSGDNTWDCNVVDYLYGSNTKIVGSSGIYTISNKIQNGDYYFSKRSVYLHHALTQVVFKMQSVAGRSVNSDYDYVKRITISVTGATNSFFSGNGVMSLKGGLLSSLSTQESIQFSAKDSKHILCGATGSPVVVGYGLVAPTDLSTADHVEIEFLLGNKDNSDKDRIQRVIHDNFKIKMEKGRRYIFNLSLGDHKIEVSETSIGEWNEVPVTGDMLPDGL